MRSNVDRMQDVRDLLALLERRSSAWRRQRWYAAVFGLLNTGVGVWLVMSIHSLAQASAGWDAGIVWLCPLAWFLMLQGVWVTVGVLSRWKGDIITLAVKSVLEQNLEGGRSIGSGSTRPLE